MDFSAEFKGGFVVCSALMEVTSSRSFEEGEGGNPAATKVDENVEQKKYNGHLGFCIGLQSSKLYKVVQPNHSLSSFSLYAFHLGQSDDFVLPSCLHCHI